jgi:hypothetical protein
LLARGTARFDAAIARVRAGAKSAGLEGALNSLGAELKSEAIPERLRDVAGRLAAILGNGSGNASSRGDASAVPATVPSLEVALGHHASARGANGSAAISSGGMHAAGPDAVCPFTGLRADEMGFGSAHGVAVDPAPEGAPPHAAPVQPVVTAPPEAVPQAIATPEPAQVPPAEGEQHSKAGAAAPVSDVKRDIEARGAVREQNTESDSAQPAKRRARADSGNHEKRKERLAGASSVANTSGRSATRPAAKRPRSRADNTRKKT